MVKLTEGGVETRTKRGALAGIEFGETYNLVGRRLKPDDR